VACEHLPRSAPFSVLFLVLLHIVEVPLNESLVARAREEEFLLFVADLFLTDCESRDPAAVAFEETLVLESVL
jgi:hypothetical protein